VENITQAEKGHCLLLWTVLRLCGSCGEFRGLGLNEASMSGGTPGHVVNGEQVSQQGQTAPPHNSAPPPNSGSNQGGSFWSHLFSFDGTANASQTQSQSASPGSSPGSSRGFASQIPVWLATLKSLQLSSLFEGLHFAPNFKGFALIFGFAGWLFVVQYVKDHDHGPNKTVSNPSTNFATNSSNFATNFGAPTANDQVLVNATRAAYPFGMSTAPAPVVERSVRMDGGPGQAMSANYNSDQRFGSPNDYFRTAPTPGYLSAQEPILPAAVQPAQQVQIPVQMPAIRGNEMNQPPAYNIQMNSVNGTWLRTIVTR